MGRTIFYWLKLVPGPFFARTKFFVTGLLVSIYDIFKIVIFVTICKLQSFQLVGFTNHLTISTTPVGPTKSTSASKNILDGKLVAKILKQPMKLMGSRLVVCSQSFINHFFYFFTHLGRPSGARLSIDTSSCSVCRYKLPNALSRGIQALSC